MPGSACIQAHGMSREYAIREREREREREGGEGLKQRLAEAEAAAFSLWPNEGEIQALVWGVSIVEPHTVSLCSIRSFFDSKTKTKE